YLVNITIPTGYPVWHITHLLATIKTPSQDVAPPVLTHINAKPYFEHNKSYFVEFNITDNTSVGNVSAYYRESENWVGLSLSNVSGTYNTSINVTNSSIGKIDLKIVANDTSQNQVEYLIMPVALTKIDPVIALAPVSVVEGGEVTASGNITDACGTGINRLKIYFFVDGNYTNMSKTDSSGIYSTQFNVSCGTSDINFSVVFNGSGIYGSKEQQFQIERVVLDFSVNNTSFIHQSLPINFTAAGATITINRSDINWSYSTMMASDKFAFTPRNYGNYTITMNSTCTNTTKEVFVNTTTAPNISSPEMSLLYPLENTAFTATLGLESQTGYSLGANISNSSSTETLNVNWTGQSLLDATTSEPYNSSSNTWVTSINTSAGKYNITASLTDDTGQAANKSTLIYVFPVVNAAFNITNHTGQANNRVVSISIGSENNTYGVYEISGVSAITTPNNSYFYPDLDLPMHVQVKKEISSNENASVTFLNSTIGTAMNLVSTYYENKEEFSNRIIYGIYAYNPCWNYNTSRLYLRLSTDPMRISGSATIYACESWNFDSASCTSGWMDADIAYTNFQGNLVEIEGLSNKTEAFALGEPSYCGDGHCSAFESCSSCAADCGLCSTPSDDPPVVPSGGGDTPLKSITTTPNEIITKISVNLKTEILGPSLSVSKRTSSSVGSSAANAVYHYFEISTVNITDSNIENTTIEFTVNNSWIADNDIDPDSIALNRYTTRWTALPTTRKSNDGTYAYYFAETPGFSLFAITGIELETQQASAQPNSTVECPICPECGEWSGCISSQKTRLCYSCDAETEYICQRYSDTEDCDIEQATTTPEKKSSAWKYVLLTIVVIVIAVIALSIVPDKKIQPKRRPRAPI
ncbi:MAG: PGF-pre-PGF domain-containing protein, partial [Candidatus Aenigmarchaeota archaeon]|nr:PGF-pre-PGF domain-containing protein [Candidatus Aenigmarchaeota archaeon]